MLISERRRLKALRDERRERLNGRCPSYKITTWVPEKYVLLDTETGDRWGFSLQHDGEIRTRRIPVDDMEVVLEALGKIERR